MVFKEFNPFQFKKQQIKKKQDVFYKHYHTPSFPKADNITSSIIFHAANLGGIIAGGTALKFYNPNWRTSDVDIIVKGNKLFFAQKLVHRLEKQHGRRFKIQNKTKSVSIWDTVTRRFVADVVNYPIEEEHISYINDGIQIAKPEFVFKGKELQTMEKGFFIRDKISKFI
jgi:hypothetical protein